MKNSKIAWTDHTFNLVWGCKEVVSECANCYAHTWANRMGYGDTWDRPNQPSIRRVMSDSYWKEPLKWNKEAAKAEERKRVFCGSMCDWLDEHPVTNEEREKLYPLIDATPWLDWLLLSKRISNFGYTIPPVWVGGGLPHNVWVGISAGQQSTWDASWPILDTIKWMYRRIAFVSVEPMIGPLDIRPHLELKQIGSAGATRPTQIPDWIIIGGESEQPGGIPVREMKLEWVYDLIDQVKDSGHPIKIFMKQLGTAWAREAGIYSEDPKGDIMAYWPEDLRLQEVPDVPIVF